MRSYFATRNDEGLFTGIFGLLIGIVISFILSCITFLLAKELTPWLFIPLLVIPPILTGLIVPHIIYRRIEAKDAKFYFGISAFPGFFGSAVGIMLAVILLIH